MGTVQGLRDCPLQRSPERLRMLSGSPLPPFRRLSGTMTGSVRMSTTPTTSSRPALGPMRRMESGWRMHTMRCEETQPARWRAAASTSHVCCGTLVWTRTPHPSPSTSPTEIGSRCPACRSTLVALVAVAGGRTTQRGTTASQSLHPQLAPLVHWLPSCCPLWGCPHPLGTGVERRARRDSSPPPYPRLSPSEGRASRVPPTSTARARACPGPVASSLVATLVLQRPGVRTPRPMQPWRGTPATLPCVHSWAPPRCIDRARHQGC